MAHHLVEKVLLKVPYRQRVPTSPRRMRVLLAQSPRRLTKVLDAVTRSAFVLLRYEGKH
ncbi:MAG: hypothetical protein ACO3JL_18890 [Myxococcota bacterium]